MVTISAPTFAIVLFIFPSSQIINVVPINLAAENFLGLLYCVPALQVNYHRNRNVVLDTLIAVFIALRVKDHMRRKVPEFKDFYEFSLCSNTIVSI